MFSSWHDRAILLVALLFFASLYFQSFWLSAAVFVAAVVLGTSKTERSQQRMQKFIRRAYITRKETRE